jgi:hypothetical protein
MAFSPRQIPGFGLANGEGCERLWSYLRHLVPLNRTSNAAHRLINIHELTLQYNDELRTNLRKFGLLSRLPRRTL